MKTPFIRKPEIPRLTYDSRSVPRRFIRVVFSFFVLAACLSGCESSPKDLYSWESYEPQVYAHLTGESREAQLIALERGRQEIEARGDSVPPGFYAQLGLLYAESGNEAMAITCLTAEKTRFPEAAAYMDFLIRRYER